MALALMSILMALRLFTLPAIPADITSAADRALYLAEHYWDHTPLSDSLVQDHAEEFEQYLADYLSIMPLLTSKAQEEMLTPLLVVATPLLRRYLTGKDSPVADPGLYNRVLCSLSKGHSPLEVRLRYKPGCAVCMEIMEQIDKSDTLRLAQERQQLILRMQQAAGEPGMLLFSADGKCLSNDLSVAELELIIGQIAR